MDNHDLFAEIDLLYRAVANPQYFDELLLLLRKKTQSCSGTIQVDNYRTMEVLGGCFQGIDESSLVSYKAHYSKHNVLTQAAAKDPELFNKIFISDQLLSLKSFKQSAFYNEWVNPEMGTDYSIWLSLNDDRENMINLTLQRAAGARSYADDGTKQYLTRLRPYLSAAFNAISTLTQNGREKDALAYIGKPAVLLDSQLRIIEANTEFEHFAAVNPWLLSERRNQIKLPKSIRNALSAKIQSYTNLTTIPFAKEYFSYQHTALQYFEFSVLPYTKESDSVFHLKGSQRLALLSINCGSKQLDPIVLSKIYGLTPVETTTAAFIFQGFCIKAISSKTGRSEHTLRSLLKTIYQKCEVHRQAELVAKIAVSSAFR